MKERSVDMRISWCLWNLIALAIPVAILISIGGLKLGLSGLLSYCYALLAVAYYLFDQHLRVTNEKIKYPYTRKYGSFIIMIGILVFFAIYNLQSRIVDINNTGLIILFILILIIAFPMAYLLSLPLLNRQVREEEKRDEYLQNISSEQQETRSSTREDTKAVVEEL